MSQEHKDELRNFSQRLYRLRQEEPQDGFTVPSGYFNALQEELLQRVREEGREAPVRRLPQRMFRHRWTVGLAASIALLIGLFFWMPDRADYDVNGGLASVETNALQQYVDQHIEEFDTDLIVESADGIDNDLSFLENDIRLNTQEMDALLDELLQDMDEQDIEELL